MKKAGIICTIIMCAAVLLGVPAFCMGHLNAKSVTMKVGDSAELEVTNPMMGLTARYISEDKQIVHAEKDGTITAYGPGTTNVLVKTWFRTLTCKVFVLGFLDETVEMLAGQTAEPQILGASEDAVFSSSDESVVQVVDGKLKTLKSGSATLTCKDKGLEVSQTIEVSGIISEDSFLFVGNQMQLGVDERFYVTASNWSVDDPEVAAVSEDGLLTGISPGTVEVSCQIEDGSIFDTSIDVVGMEEEEWYLLLDEESKVPLASGKGFDTSEMEWLSRDPQVADVDGTGKVRAAGLGDTTVVGRLGEQEISCSVHVVQVPEKAFTVVGVSAEFQKADNGNTFIWNSRDESVVKMDNGMLLGVSEGTTEIYAEAGSRTFTCPVTVGKMNKASVTLSESQTDTLEVTGTEGQDVRWYSVDDSVATVSDSGEITPVEEGETEILCAVGTSVLAIPVTVGSTTTYGTQSVTGTGTSTQSDLAAAREAAVQKAMEEALGLDGTTDDTDTSSKTSSKTSSSGTSGSSVKEPEIVAHSDGTLSGPQALVACGNYYNSVLLERTAKGDKWVYSNSSKYVAQTGTFETMLRGKIHGGNCASIANWAFKDMGILSKNQRFYGNSSGKIQNYNAGGTSVKPAIDKACTVTAAGGKSFRTLMDQGKIKVGDILIGKSHTYIYRGDGTVFASGHDAKWHKDSAVKTDDSKKAVFDNWVRKYKGSYDETCKVYYIIRIKDSFTPKYYRDTDGNLVKNQA